MLPSALSYILSLRGIIIITVVMPEEVEAVVVVAVAVVVVEAVEAAAVETLAIISLANSLRALKLPS